MKWKKKLKIMEVDRQTNIQTDTTIPHILVCLVSHAIFVFVFVCIYVYKQSRKLTVLKTY